MAANDPFGEIIKKAEDLWKKGDAAGALVALKAALEDEPDNIQVLLSLGKVYIGLGDFKNAVTALQRACHLSPRNPAILVPYSRALSGIGNNTDAMTIAETSIRLKPDSIEVLENGCNVFFMAGKVSEVINCLERLSALKPKEKHYYRELNRFYEQNRQYEEAHNTFKKIWDENTDTLWDGSPANAFDYATAGEYAYYAQDAKRAIANLEKSLALEPNNPNRWSFLGRCHSSMGDKKAAKEAFEKALAVNPRFIPAYYYLSRISGFPEGDPAFATLEGLKGNENLSIGDKSNLGFALGRMYHGTQEYDKAFENFSNGNAFSREHSTALGYSFKGAGNRAGLKQSLELMAALYSPENRKKLKYKGSSSNKPVFIVGMQRSGTTLLEQIMAAHSEISSAGELTYLAINHRELMIRTATLEGRAREVALLKAIDEDAGNFAAMFLKALEKKGDDTPMIIDKLPQNFMQLGLINVLFPNAKVIHMKRDPLDIGLSIFCSQFSADLTFAQNLADIGFYICQYRKLMADWKNLLDLPIHEVDYEALVEDPELIARGVIEFCGLEWQPECLEFYKNPGMVFTSSVMQVREPINKSAVGKWKAYEKHLGPLKKALEG